MIVGDAMAERSLAKQLQDIKLGDGLAPSLMEAGRAIQRSLVSADRAHKPRRPRSRRHHQDHRALSVTGIGLGIVAKTLVLAAG
jgi:hypothetical protein